MRFHLALGKGCSVVVLVGKARQFDAQRLFHNTRHRVSAGGGAQGHDGILEGFEQLYR